MNSRPRLVSAPADTPVSVSQAKAHIRVGHSEDDTLISALIAAAVSLLDGHAGILGRCIVTQTWEQDFSCWPGNNLLRLPFPDVDPDSVEITYRDASDIEQTLSADHYETFEDAISTVIAFREAFTSPALCSDRRAPVTVTFDAGFGAAADVPAAIKHAVLLSVADFYENRENTVVGQVTVSELPMGAMFLIAPLRRSGA